MNNIHLSVVLGLTPTPAVYVIKSMSSSLLICARPNLKQPNDPVSAHRHWTWMEVWLFLKSNKLICFHLEADRGTLPQEFYTVLKRLRPAVIYVINYSADGWHAQPDPRCIVFLLLGFCPSVHPLLGSK